MNTIASQAMGSASDAVRKLNPHLFQTAESFNVPKLGRSQLAPDKNPQVECARPKGKTLCEVFAAEAGKRIRQRSGPLMNKLEESFWREHLAEWRKGSRPQAIKFRLGNGIVYTPDFVDLTSTPVRAYEVKGPKAFRGGFENLKVAASLYPEVRWTLVWKENGNWKQQEVLP